MRAEEATTLQIGRIDDRIGRQVRSPTPTSDFTFPGCSVGVGVSLSAKDSLHEAAQRLAVSSWQYLSLVHRQPLLYHRW